MLFAIRLFLFHLSTLHVVFISRPTLHFLFFFPHSIAYEFHIQTRSYTAFIDDSVIFSWSCHLYLISRRPNILSRKGNCYESKRDDFPKTIFFTSKPLNIFRIPVLGIPGSSFRTVESIICTKPKKNTLRPLASSNTTLLLSRPRLPL